jgi:Ohr subfamily peroxiredoxin
MLLDWSEFGATRRNKLTAQAMSEYAQLMPKPIYTAHATVTGGRSEGHGISNDGVLDVQLRAPAEMGGDGSAPGTNPEQLFAVGYAACFESALGAIARRQKLEVGEVSIDAGVSLSPDGRGGFGLAVALAVTLLAIADAEQAKQIVASAHEVCPYSNATRGNIEVTLTANGEPV